MDHRPRQTRRCVPRVTTACTACRTRRSKCDAARPQCGNCHRLALYCEYSAVDGRKSRHTNAEVGALQDRIALLERQLQQIQTSCPAPCSSSSSLTQNTHALQILPAPEPWEQNTVGHEALLPSSLQWDLVGNDSESLWPFFDDDWGDTLPYGLRDSESSQSSSHSAVEALVSVMANIHIDGSDGQPYYIGPTSGMHVLQRLRRSPTIDFAPRRMPRLVRGSGSIYEPIVPEDYILRLFWDRFHSHYPVFGHNDWEQRCREVATIRWTPFLNSIVLAVGSWNLRPGDSHFDLRQSCLSEYLERFTSAIGEEMENVCLANVQAFVLRSYLAVVQGKPESATIFLGIACGMAKRMGLHVGHSTHNLLSPAMQDVQDAVFWVCLRLDRDLALIEGRACLMAACDVSAARPYNLLRMNSLDFSACPLSLELMHACHLEFAHLQDLHLAKIYSFDTPLPRENAISEGHVAYVSWYADLPSCIKDYKSCRAFHPSVLSLHMYYQSGFILLRRSSLRDDGPSGELARQQSRKSAGIVAALLKSYEHLFDVAIADFMVIHAALTAALMHLTLLQEPNASTYRSAVRALKSTVLIMSKMISHCGYAKVAYDNLRDFANECNIVPANSASFWPVD